MQPHGCSVQVIASLHGILPSSFPPPSTIFPGDARPPFRLGQLFVEGGTLAYLIRIAGHQIIVFGSMNYIEREVEGLRPDVALIGAMPERRKIYRYTERLLHALGYPPLVMPTHWDRFNVGYDVSQQPAIDRVQSFIAEVIVFAAWQALPNFRGDANLRSWVMGVARHKLEDYYRRKIRAIEVSEEEEDSLDQATTPAFEQQLDSVTQQQNVQRTLAMLPEAYALALIWQYRDEKSVREMAELTGKTEKAMERLLARARESFRRRWRDGQL